VAAESAAMEVLPLTASQARTIASWRYPGAYATYDFAAADELARDHWAVIESGELVGYCCFGPPARVPGAHERPGTLDLGYGLAPERMAQHAGRRFVGAILEFAEKRFEVDQFRLYILDWNRRSQKVAEALGFAFESILKSGEGTFMVFVRDVGA